MGGRAGELDGDGLSTGELPLFDGGSLDPPVDAPVDPPFTGPVHPPRFERPPP